MNELKQVLVEYNNLPFHKWISNNTPLNAFKTQVDEMLWHQQLMHLFPATFKSAYKYCDGIPNLSNFDFDDIKNCPICIKASMRKNTASKQSLTESVVHPYQGVFIDLVFSDVFLMIKMAKLYYLVVYMSKVSTVNWFGF